MTFLLTLVTYIPFLGNVAQKWIAGYYDSKTQIVVAQTGGQREVAQEVLRSRVAGLQVIAGSKLLTLLVIAFAAPLMVFEWKIIVWDICLGWGTTDPIRGQVAEWANTIITCLFGSATAMTVVGTVVRWGK